MKAIIYFIAIFLFATYSSNSQSLNIIRSDVDSARQSFVTATFTFGIDIVSQDVSNCNTIAFELHFNHASYIKLSGWRVLELGDNSTSLVISRENIYTDEGVVSVGVASGEDLVVASKDNPRVIHLEFVVTQSAVHFDILTFTFINAYAVVNNNGLGEKLSLRGGPFSFNVHSFVEVWPGDADNDGYVNTNDIAQIGLYHGFGINSKSLRTFKRQSPSVLWYPQQSLAWDSSTVTFADCDGDGAVTMRDILVVALNYDKVHYINSIKDNEIQTIAEPVNSAFFNNLIYPQSLKTDKSISIPIVIKNNRQFIAAAIKLNISNLADKFKILGFEKGDLFEFSESFIYYKIDERTQTVEIATGSLKSNNVTETSGTLINLIVEPLSGDPTIQEVLIEEMIAIDKTGSIFRMDNVSEVKDNRNDINFEFQLTNDLLFVRFNKSIPHSEIKLALYDLFGTIFASCSFTLNDSTIPTIDVSALSQGIYFIVVEYENEKHVRTLTRLK